MTTLIDQENWLLVSIELDRVKAENKRLKKIALAAEELAKAVQVMRGGPIGVSIEVHEAARAFNLILGEIDATR